jgi:hypothetical protein
MFSNLIASRVVPYVVLLEKSCKVHNEHAESLYLSAKPTTGNTSLDSRRLSFDILLKPLNAIVKEKKKKHLWISRYEEKD